MSLLSKLASSTYIIAEANIWLPVLPSTPGHLLGVFEALGYRFQLLACFFLVMISLLAGFHVCEYVCHLGMYLQRLHRKWWKLLRTQWLSAVILMQMRHKCCVGQGNVTSSCYVNFSSNLTSLQFIQISEPDKCHLASFISLFVNLSFTLVYNLQDVAVSLTLAFQYLFFCPCSALSIDPTSVNESPSLLCLHFFFVHTFLSLLEGVRAHRGHKWSLPDQIKAHCLLVCPFPLTHAWFSGSC